MRRTQPSAHLVGRDAEIEAATACVASAGRGRGGLLLITGEAGVGKSRVMMRIGEVATNSGLTVLRGSCASGAGAYRPVVQALLAGAAPIDAPELRPYRSALAAVLPGSSDGQVLDMPDPVLVLGEGLLALLTLMAGPGRGTVLLLEDLHAADPDTVGLLQYLAGRVVGAPVLIVGSARTDEQPVGDAMGPTVRVLLDHDATQIISLGRLEPAQVWELVGRLHRGPELPVAVRDFLVEKADGLPLLVEELLAGLIESGSVSAGPRGWTVRDDLDAGVPASLSVLVRRRLERLPGVPRRIVEAAAVLGLFVDWRLLSDVVEEPAASVFAALRAAVDVGLMEPAQRDAGQAALLHWRHGLVRDAVLAQLLPPERAALAGLAADSLERRSPGSGGASSDADLALAAEFRIAAGQPELAAALFVDLGRRTLAAGALGSSIPWFERACGLGSADGALPAMRVRALTAVGRAAEALTVGAGALDLLAGDDHAELCLQLTRAAITAADWSAALSYLERSGRSGLTARADALAADALFGAGEFGQAERLAQRAMQSADLDHETRCAALNVAARCALQTDMHAGESAFRLASVVAAEHGLTPWRIRALVGVGTVEMSRLDISPALNEARQLAVDAGMLALTASVDLLLADGRLVVAGPAAAQPVARRSADLATRIGLGDLAAVALTLVGTEDACHGPAATMESTLRDALSSSPRSPVIPALVDFARAFRPLLADDLPATRDLLDAAMQRRAVGAPLAHWGLWVLVRTILADRDLQAREALRTSPAMNRVVNRAGLEFAEAVAAGREGDTARALQCFSEADQMLSTQHWWRHLLRLLALHGAVENRWGTPIAALRADLAEFEATGETQLARTARDLLRRAGVTVRRGRGDSPVPAPLGALGITRREVDVLTLVTSGLTNTEIASRLFLSVRTVDHHVANLLAKTGTVNRAELSSRVEAIRQ